MHVHTHACTHAHTHTHTHTRVITHRGWEDCVWVQVDWQSVAKLGNEDEMHGDGELKET